MKTFRSLEEMQPYYNRDSNTYEFCENDSYIDVCFEFDLSIESHINAENINALDINVWNIDAGNINAGNINAQNINAWNIDAWNIDAWNINAGNINAQNINARNIDAYNIDARYINAGNISFCAVCFAYQDIICNSITGRRENAKYFCLDGEVKLKEETEVV